LAVDPAYELRVKEFKNVEFFVGGDTDRAEDEEFVGKNPNGGRLLPGDKDAQEVMSGALESVTSCIPFGWASGKNSRAWQPRCTLTSNPT
jgi:hypothetical protein